MTEHHKLKYGTPSQIGTERVAVRWVLNDVVALRVLDPHRPTNLEVKVGEHFDIGDASWVITDIESLDDPAALGSTAATIRSVEILTE